MEYLPPYLLYCRERSIHVKSEKTVTLKASGILSKFVVQRVGQDVLILGLCEDDTLNLWKLSKAVSNTSPKILDLSSHFQGKIIDLAFSSESTTLLGIADSNEQLALVEITDISDACNVKCHMQTGLTKDEYLSMSFGERIAYDKELRKRAKTEVKPVEKKKHKEDVSGRTETSVTQMRALLRSIIHSKEKFREDLMISLQPKNDQQALKLKAAFSGLNPGEIDELLRLSMDLFASSPVEHIQVLVWMRVMVECSAPFLSLRSKEVLGGLNEEIGERIEVYRECLRLQGRTKLLVKQLGSRRQSHIPMEEELLEASASEENSEDYSEDNSDPGDDGYSNSDSSSPMDEASDSG